MEAPGVDVRPLYQITGEAEFNEVFLSDVRIPNESMLGEEGQGWRVAITTLMNERVAIGGGEALGRKKPIDHLFDLWRGRADAGARGAVLRDRVTQRFIESRLLEIDAEHIEMLTGGLRKASLELVFVMIHFVRGRAGRAMDVRHLSAACLLYTSPSPRDVEESRMPSSA